MKTLLKLTLALLVIPISMSAQSNVEEVDYIQSIFGMEKKAIVADFIKLDDDNPAPRISIFFIKVLLYC